MGEQKSALILLLILCSLLVAFPNVVIVKAEGTIHIRADGSVEGTDKIQQDGDVYTFIENIGGSIVVQKDNVVVDGEGYSLIGRGGTGIQLVNRTNVYITNLEITGFGEGIYFSACYHNSISETDIINNVNGVELHYSFNNSILFNGIMNSSGFGIVLNGSEQNHINSNGFVNNSIQVQSISSSNIWNDGPQGNLWSDYEGVDLNFDGKGDTPYIIDENNQDNYPMYKDWISPTIYIISPFGVAYSTRDLHLSYVLEEQFLLLSYSLDGQENVTLVGNNTILSGLSEGSHNIVMYGINTNGEYGRSDRRFFIVDYSCPQIIVLSFENKTYYESEIPLSFSINEQVTSIFYSLDGEANVTIAGNSTLTGLTEGPHNLTFFAEDRAGNVGFSETIFFTKNKAELFPTGLLIGFLVIVGVTVLFFIKQRKKSEVE